MIPHKMIKKWMAKFLKEREEAEVEVTVDELCTLVSDEFSLYDSNENTPEEVIALAKLMLEE